MNTQIIQESPWIDRENAIDILKEKMGGIPEYLVQGAKEIITDGLTIQKGVIDKKLCDQVTYDYDKFLQNNKKYASQYCDELGRHNRLVNFHLESKAALEAGHNENIMTFLDFIFGYKAAIYTSLTFEYSSEQPIHRDSPFFHTFPSNYFVGVWVALEDVTEDSGPLFYIPGGHRKNIDQHEIYDRVCSNNKNLDHDELVERSLQEYYKMIITTYQTDERKKTALLKKGDIAIWHAKLPHGGKTATNKLKTRKSIVFHCTPEDVQVYQQDIFFSYQEIKAPRPRYPFKKSGNRSFALAGEVSFM